MESGDGVDGGLKVRGDLGMVHNSIADCHALYTICAQMCVALKNNGQPFGGMNMIFVGDFAQLSPSMSGLALYDYQIGHTVYTTNSDFEQEGSISKAV